MKKIILIFWCTFYTLNSTSQMVIPQNIPCITITQSNLPALGSGIAGVDCIETDGNVTFEQNENYSIKAGEYISFGQNTVIDPDAAHQFHAYIDNSGMDVAWYYPNATPGTVGQYEKLELGVEFSDDIDQLIENFTNSSPTTPNLNPFNPEQVNLFAEFWWYNENPLIVGQPEGWYGPQLINGFYYEEFVRGSTDWTQQANEHDFRIRFAPRLTGLWRCKITAVVQGVGTFMSSEFTFNCVHSGSKDFMRVGENGQYFKIGNEPFFPVGHNLSYPRPESGCCEFNAAFILEPEVFEAYELQLQTLAENGANYVRIINNPMSTDIEFEKLNDYSDRMIHAWEMDNILNVAEQENLRIHYDLMLQNYFDVSHAFGANQWDWSATNDPGNNGATCVAPDDFGYCYRSELGLIDPKAFFSDVEAMKFYKYKLRYLIARYGYSNEIAVIELQSEVNNTAVYLPKELLPTGSLDENGNVQMGCYNIEAEIYNPYKENYPGYIEDIYAWQNEMCRYIKVDLQHTNQPLAVSYSGEPDIANGDSTYYSEFVDIITYNYYGNSIEKAFNVKAKIDEYCAIGKPLMFCEYGANDGTSACDQGVDFIKTIILTPFVGIAGSAMNWDWQYPGQDQYWNHFAPLNNLMTGIKLDEENWQVGEPQESIDGRVELLYLERPQIDGHRKIVGALSNRTYNYYTQGPVGSFCKENAPAAEYQNETSYLWNDLWNSYTLSQMGIWNEYQINWYNGLTGVQVATDTLSSDLFGSLLLVMPINVHLSGNEVQPILFFELYPLGQTFKSAEQVSDKIPIKYFSMDSAILIVSKTNWNQQMEDQTYSKQDFISVSPNPTSEIVNISFNSIEMKNRKWNLTDSNGNILNEGDINFLFMTLDLSGYDDGVYYYTLIDNSKISSVKIIKQ